MPIADVGYALESPWPCDGLELGPDQGGAALQALFATLSLASGRQGSLLNDAISLNRRRWL